MKKESSRIMETKENVDKWIEELNISKKRYTFGNKAWQVTTTDYEDYPFNVQYLYSNYEYTATAGGRFCKTLVEAREYILEGLEEHFNFDALQIHYLRDAFFGRESEGVINFIGQINPKTNAPIYNAYQMRELHYALANPRLTTENAHFIGQINPETNVPIFSWNQMQELLCAFVNGKSLEDIKREAPPAFLKKIERAEAIIAAKKAREEVTDAPSLHAEGRDAQAASKELNAAQTATPARATERN